METRHWLGLLSAYSDLDQAASLRMAFRKDLWLLMVLGLNREDMIHPWLYARCREVQVNPDGYLDLWAREHYKALAIHTPVWTANGWKRHGDLGAGDLVFAPHGGLVRVLANTGVMECADCYQISMDCGASFIAAGDHRWKTYRKHKNRIAVGSDARVVTFSEEVIGTRSMQAGARIDRTPTLEGVAHLRIDPYLLGCWLGDGHTADGRITCADPIWKDLGEYSEPHDRAGLTRTVYGLRPELRALGALGNKHLPQDYWYAAPHDRLAVLQGLLDTDGHCHAIHGRVTFSNTNERLVEAAAFLSRSLGVPAHVARRNGYWQVTMQPHKEDRFFRLQRKLDRCSTGPRRKHRYVRSVEKCEWMPVNCIQVEGGMYLAGKELVPTCNSTIITFGKTTQDILCSHGDDPLPEWRGIEPSFGIFSYIRPRAKDFLRQIKNEFERNSLLKMLFPDVLYENPERQSPRWSEDAGILVRRRTTPREGTVEAHGLVDGQPTGKHFNVLIYDDVVTDSSVTSHEMIEKTTKAWRVSINLGDKDCRIRMIGTRWHFADTYREVLATGSAKPRIHKATDDGTLKGKPVLLNEAQFAAKLKQGPYIASAQLLMNPVAESDQRFDREWLSREFNRDEGWQAMNRALTCDPASGKKNGDYTAMAVIGYGPDENIYVLDLIRDRLTLKQRADEYMRLHRKWTPKWCGYEEYGLQADIEYIKERMNRETYHFDIEPLKGKLSKFDRVNRLIPIASEGRLWFPNNIWRTNHEGKLEDLAKVVIEEEFLQWPVPPHDDAIDAISRVIDLEMSFPKPSVPDRKDDRYTKRKKAGSWMAN